MVLEPYVAIIGSSLSNIIASYVVIQNQTYQVNSPTQAVDICFQFVRVFHSKFSHMCNHVWQFIEKEAYDMTSTSTMYKGVSELIESIGNYVIEK